MKNSSSIKLGPKLEYEIARTCREHRCTKSEAVRLLCWEGLNKGLPPQVKVHTQWSHSAVDVLAKINSEIRNIRDTAREIKALVGVLGDEAKHQKAYQLIDELSGIHAEFLRLLSLLGGLSAEDVADLRSAWKRWSENQQKLPLDERGGTLAAAVRSLHLLGFGRREEGEKGPNVFGK